MSAQGVVISLLVKVYQSIIIIVVVIYCVNDISNDSNTTENRKCNRNESEAGNGLYGDQTPQPSPLAVSAVFFTAAENPPKNN